MAQPLKNVILVGAGGNLGPSVLQEFLASDFNVTVLSRSDSRSTFPSGVTIIKSDWSAKSLEWAFAGQDAVISLIGHDSAAAQKALIDAAIAAGVRRFIPSEFGHNTSDPRVLSLAPPLEGKRQVVKYLQSKESSISWTALITGQFLDWGLKVGFLGFNLEEKSVRLFDSGEAKFATTTLKTVSQALVSVLAADMYQKTKNKYIFACSFVITQKELLARLEHITGAQWHVSQDVDVEARVREAHQQLAQGDYSSVVDLLLSVSYGLPKDDLNESLTLVLKSMGLSVHSE